MEFTARTEAMIETWHATQPPNPAAQRFTADLAAVIAHFEALRGSLAFESEPSDFAAALRDTKA